MKASVSISVFASLACLTSLSTFVLSSSYSHAETTDTALASVTVPDVCTLEDSVVGTAHTATVSVGSYTPNIGETTIKVTCNDNNGYSLYAVGYSNDTVGNTNLIGTNGNIVTGTANDGSVSNWAMKLTAVSNSFTPTILNGYDNYHVVPDTATKVATRTESIDASSTSEIKTTYAVSISPSQAKGDYTGKVKYTVVHPHYANANGTVDSYDIPINFVGAGIESVTFTASSYPSRTVTTSGNSVNLVNGVEYTVTASITSNYEFVSWSLNNSSYGSLGSTSTNPTTFTPNTNSTNAIITITGQKIVIDYCDVNNVADENCMQAMTLSQCPTEGKTVTDARDGSTYTIKKLADGKCWMTQNLALDLTAFTQEDLYGSGATAGRMTNASSTSLGYLMNGGGTTSDRYATAKLNNETWTSASQNFFSVPMMVSSGVCNNAQCANTNLTWSYDDVLPATINGTTSRVQGKIGIYYNFCAASAGSYCYGDGTSEGTSTGNATEDICPYGWRLPVGKRYANDTVLGEYQSLYQAYSSNYNNYVDALSFPLSGGFNVGVAVSQGWFGTLWSSTRVSNTGMSIAQINYQTASVDYSSSRVSGYSIRCLKAS